MKREKWTDLDEGIRLQQIETLLAMAKLYPDGVVPLGRILRGNEASDGRRLHFCDYCDYAVWLPVYEFPPVRKCERCKETAIFYEKE